METLVVVAQHRNHHHHQYYSGRISQGPARLGSFGSPEINCRSFESGAGILPTPLKACTTPVTKRASSFTSSPKTPSVNSHTDDTRNAKRALKSSAIPIPIRINYESNNEGSFNLNDEFAFSELWAGPTYSNSPPPSSLPIPKFSMRPKRTVSLDLPASPPSGDINFHPIAKSAPPSPTREHNHSHRDLFRSADSATLALRRILNLENSDS